MNQPSDAERDGVLGTKDVRHRDFRAELIRAEKHVCDLISSMLLDNELRDVVDQLTSVRRSIHYTLAHNELPVPTLQELTVAMPVRVPDGAMVSLVIARDIAIQNRLKTRLLDSAIETLEHAIRRSRYAIHGEPSSLKHGVRRVFVATDNTTFNPIRFGQVAMVDDAGNELFLIDKDFVASARDASWSESVQPMTIIRSMIHNYIVDRSMTRGRNIELWGFGTRCSYDFVTIRHAVSHEGLPRWFPDNIYNIQQLHESFPRVAAPKLHDACSVLEEARWIKSYFEAIQAASAAATALAESVSKK